MSCQEHQERKESTLFMEKTGGEEKGQEGERETERDLFHRFLKAYFM